MPTKTTKTTKSTEPKNATAKATAPKAAAAKTATAKSATAKTAAAKATTTKSTAAKTAKPAAAGKARTRVAKPAAAPKAKAGKPTIVDTVRAVVDAAAAIVGAAVTVNAAVGPKTGKTARQVTRALDAAAGVTAAAAVLVDLNRAAPDALASLKGIGPKRAQRIVEARPFQAVDDLAARKLLPRKAVDELRGKLSV